MNKKIMTLCCYAGIIMLWGWYEIFSRAVFYSQSGSALRPHLVASSPYDIIDWCILG